MKPKQLNGEGWMKVVHVITSTSHGGAETHLLSLSKWQASRGCHVEVVSMLSPGTLSDEFRNAGISVRTLGMKAGKVSPSPVRTLRQYFRETKPDIVHAHMMPASIISRVSRLGLRVPVLVSTAHSTREKYLWRNLMFGLTDRLAEHTTNVSRRGLDRYRRLGLVSKSRSSYIPNGIEFQGELVSRERRESIRQSLGVGDSTFLWISVGRLSPEKDYPNLLSAVSRMATEDRDIKFLIVGAGPLEPEIRRLIEAHSVGSAVSLLGLRRDVPELLAASDGFVLSSSLEGLPMVILEAAVRALPIVSTNVGGVGDVVRDGYSGRIVRVGDSVALSEGIREVSEMSIEERGVMGARVKAHVEEMFSMDELGRKWLNLYRELLLKSEFGGELGAGQG